MTDPATRPEAPNGRVSSSCIPWGFWTSTGFGILAVLAWFAVQWIAAVLVLAFLGVNAQSSAAEIKAAASHGVMVAAATIGAAPAAIAVVAFAVRRRGCEFADYLGLRRPSRSELLLGLLILAVVMPLGDMASWLTGRDIVPAYFVEAYKTARATNTVVVFLLAVVVAAPLMEELLFRGFLLPGYAASKLGPIGAVALTSLAWAVMHVQYEVFYVAQIVILGCIFGWLRLRSGSTLLTIILHAVVNSVAIAQTIYFASR
jgi:membrane protease YdiL (CAAX protease family)